MTSCVQFGDVALMDRLMAQNLARPLALLVLPFVFTACDLIPDLTEEVEKAAASNAAAASQAVRSDTTNQPTAEELREQAVEDRTFAYNQEQDRLARAEAQQAAEREDKRYEFDKNAELRNKELDVAATEAANTKNQRDAAEQNKIEVVREQERTKRRKNEYDAWLGTAVDMTGIAQKYNEAENENDIEKLNAAANQTLANAEILEAQGGGNRNLRRTDQSTLSSLRNDYVRQVRNLESSIEAATQEQNTALALKRRIDRAGNGATIVPAGSDEKEILRKTPGVEYIPASTKTETNESGLTTTSTTPERFVVISERDAKRGLDDFRKRREGTKTDLIDATKRTRQRIEETINRLRERGDAESIAEAQAWEDRLAAVDNDLERIEKGQSPIGDGSDYELDPEPSPAPAHTPAAAQSTEENPLTLGETASQDMHGQLTDADTGKVNQAYIDAAKNLRGKQASVKIDIAFYKGAIETGPDGKPKPASFNEGGEAQLIKNLGLLNVDGGGDVIGSETGDIKIATGDEAGALTPGEKAALDRTQGAFDVLSARFRNAANDQNATAESLSAAFNTTRQGIAKLAAQDGNAGIAYGELAARYLRENSGAIPDCGVICAIDAHNFSNAGLPPVSDLKAYTVTARLVKVGDDGTKTESDHSFNVYARPDGTIAEIRDPAGFASASRWDLGALKDGHVDDLKANVARAAGGAVPVEVAPVGEVDAVVPKNDADETSTTDNTTSDKAADDTPQDTSDLRDSTTDQPDKTASADAGQPANAEGTISADTAAKPNDSAAIDDAFAGVIDESDPNFVGPPSSLAGASEILGTEPGGEGGAAGAATEGVDLLASLDSNLPQSTIEDAPWFQSLEDVVDDRTATGQQQKTDPSELPRTPNLPAVGAGSPPEDPTGGVRGNPITVNFWNNYQVPNSNNIFDDLEQRATDNSNMMGPFGGDAWSPSANGQFACGDNFGFGGACDSSGIQALVQEDGPLAEFSNLVSAAASTEDLRQNLERLAELQERVISIRKNLAADAQPSSQAAAIQYGNQLAILDTIVKEMNAVGAAIEADDLARAQEVADAFAGHTSIELLNNKFSAKADVRDVPLMQSTRDGVQVAFNPYSPDANPRGEDGSTRSLR